MQHGNRSFEVVAPRSRFYHGGFGRLFPDLEPWVPKGPDGQPLTGAQLEKAAIEISQQFMTEGPQGGAGDSSLPAAYTFFGQFIDHDITLDTTSLGEADGDPNRLHNFRTPRLDLDCLYGQGPGAQPYLYDEKTRKFRIGRALVSDDGDAGSEPDLPRYTGSGEGPAALIGDHRNDENAIVAQVHLAFLRAHNTLVEESRSFDVARQSLQWLYNWIVWHDFIGRICDPRIAGNLLQLKKAPGTLAHWASGYDDLYNWKASPFMPVEFSVAAFRFGHTLVRPGYRTNGGNAFPTFAHPVTTPSLRGFRALAEERLLDWDMFLERKGAEPSKVQHSRKFDQFLAPALSTLPEDPAGRGEPTRILNVLAARNLVRAVRMELPSGTAVARALCLPVIEPGPGEPDALWYYLLKESGLSESAGGGGGNRLGPVGSILVAATIGGLLLGDPNSFFRKQPDWTPDNDPHLAKLDAGGALTQDVPDHGGDPKKKWTLAAIIRLAEMDQSHLLPPPPAAAAAS